MLKNLYLLMKNKKGLSVLMKVILAVALLAVVALIILKARDIFSETPSRFGELFNW